MNTDKKLAQIEKILMEAKRLSKEYKELTGKPLGITGEVAEFEAAKRLGDKCQDIVDTLKCQDIVDTSRYRTVKC